MWNVFFVTLGCAMIGVSIGIHFNMEPLLASIFAVGMFYVSLPFIPRD